MRKATDRQGFEAFADNLIVNFIEDHGHILVRSNEGHMSVENEKQNYSIHCTFKGEWVNIVFRAYIEDEGWKTRDWNIRRL